MRFGKRVVSEISMRVSWDRTLLGTALLATLFLTDVSGFAQETDPNPRFSPATNELSESRNEWNNRRLKPFKIVGNLYYVGLSGASSWLIATPEGHVLIDTTWPGTWSLVMENIEELGFQVRDIKYIFSTHAHVTHIAAHGIVKDLTGAKIWAAPGDAINIEDGGLSEEGRVRWKPAKVDKYLQDGDMLTLGGTTLTAHITAGHTKGCTTWTMVAGENGRKYNVVMACGNSISRPLLNNAEYPNRAADYAMAIEKMLALPCDIYLEPEGGRATNPLFTNPEEYRSYILDQQKQLREMLAKERGAADQGR